MQIIQREAEFLFRIGDVGKTRKVTHLGKRAMAVVDPVPGSMFSQAHTGPAALLAS